VNMKDAVKLDPGSDKNEWIFMHTVEVFNSVRMVYNLFAEEASGCCTSTTCPKMNAAAPKGDTVYLWADDNARRPQDMSAPDYITKLFDWVTEKIKDESVFPANSNYGKDFLPTVCTILKRLFRVYAHIFFKHRDVLKQYELEGKFILGFSYWYWFVLEFSLVKAPEMAPLESIIVEIRKKSDLESK